MGAGIGGAVGRRSGAPRRAPVEAVRGLDHTAARCRSLADAELRPPRVDGARRARRRLHDRDVGARVPLPRRPPHRSHRRLQPALPEPDRCRRPPAHRGRARGRARLVLVSGRQGRAVRRRLVGRVGRQPAGGRRRRHRRDGPLRPRARGRCDVACGAHPGRRLRTGAGGPAAAARIHAAPLPAELPLLDARRLDRHPLRRPLRDEPHPHRRLRRVGAHAHAAGLVGEPASPGLGRRAEPRPHGDRQRGDPRRDHRGVDARSSSGRRSAPPPASCSRRGRRAPMRCARSSRPSCGRRTAGSSTRWRPSGRPASTARRRSSSSASSPPSTRSATPSASPSTSLAALAASSPTTTSRSTMVDGEPTGRGGSVGAWRDAFIGVDPGVDTSLGLVADTFETAITWDRWPAFDAAVRERVSAPRSREVFGTTAELSCRFTHVYPDGPAPYYTWFGMGPQGSELVAVGRGQGGGERGGARRRRHDHPPPRRRPDAPPAVRPPATRSLRRRAAGRQARRRPGRDDEPRRPHRPCLIPFRLSGRVRPAGRVRGAGQAGTTYSGSSTYSTGGGGGAARLAPASVLRDADEIGSPALTPASRLRRWTPTCSAPPRRWPSTTPRRSTTGPSCRRLRRWSRSPRSTSRCPSTASRRWTPCASSTPPGVRRPWPRPVPATSAS